MLRLCALAASLLVALLAAAPAEAAPKCFGKKATIVGSAGKDHITGKKAPDVIVALGGDDVIDGFRGNDRICGGAGDDRIVGFRGYDRLSGDDGNDSVNGQKGTDLLWGGAGTDYMVGERGNDQIDGGAGDGDQLIGDKGNDRLDGGEGNGDYLDGALGDDTLLGGPGDGDRLIGGLGADKLDGGEGNGDVLRGDDSTDTLDGGPGGQDIASFALATPPGQGQTSDNKTVEGVIVDLRKGTASGDGWDKLSGVEDVAGSAFQDVITGDPGGNRLDGGPGDDELEGGGGSDAGFGGSGGDYCRSFLVLDSCENGNGSAIVTGGTKVELSRGLDGDTLNVVGTGAANRVSVSLNGGSYVVSDAVSQVVAADNCQPVSPTLNGGAVCPAPEGLNAIVVSLDGGDDALSVDPSLPSSVVVRANGGTGDDQLTGGSGNDTLEAGEGGKDVLNGAGGADGLVSGPGADQLNGGDGSDLLVVDTACGGHEMNGGPGVDNASFARIPTAVEATVGGTASTPSGCGNPNRLVAAENLEGSNQSDVLVGDGKNNGFLGRDGNDVIRGLGGPDRIDGAGGSDSLAGGGGKDLLVANDGQRDKRLSCGPGANAYEKAQRDKADPAAKSC
jgi:Ca2+-binding RTX toxin-like protein